MRWLAFFVVFLAGFLGAVSARASDDCLRNLGAIFPGLAARFDAIVPGRPDDTLATPRRAAPYPVDLAISTAVLGNGFEVNGVLVTRGGLAGLLMHSVRPAFNFQMGAQNSGKPPAPDPFWAPFRGQKVLLLGEGLDGRVRAAAEAGVQVRSVDLWYDAALVEAVDSRIINSAETERAFKQLVDFYRQNREWLVAGSVFDIPYAEGSFDSVMAKKLLNNFPADRQLQALREMCRVVAVGGQVRVGPGEIRAGVMDKLKAEVGDRYRFETDRIVRLL